NRHYLSFGGQTLGVLITTGPIPYVDEYKNEPPTISSVDFSQVQFWHKDHLGSLIATTNHQATVTGRYAYDPFGKRRYTNGSYDPFGTIVVDFSPNSAATAGADRGFTEHEHLDDIGLIHMNGRILDPKLGMFLQADPYVSVAKDLQGYHRYAYCLNSPLTCTDPAGFTAFDSEWGSFNYNTPHNTSYSPWPSSGVQIIEIVGSRFGMPAVLIWDASLLASSALDAMDAWMSKPGAYGSALSWTATNLIDAGITGGHGQMAVDAFRNGDFGWAIAHEVAGVAFGLGNVFGFSSSEFAALTTYVSRKVGPLLTAEAEAVGQGQWLLHALFGQRAAVHKSDFVATGAIGETGRIGELAIGDVLRPLGGLDEQTFMTPWNARVVDWILNGVAYESKVGYTSLTDFVRLQIQKDVWLREAGYVNSVEWHFFGSPITNRVGLSKPLQDELTANGIQFFVH
ncbi:MAG TPA: RHS repeat-associated core domain-containing protein, partial [Aquabacterium sp.]|nr:RHS repeat-associated core domain-containing protein [Aquabacterium sp.]